MTHGGRPRTHRRLPVVLSAGEVAAIFALIEGEHRLFAQLLYGTRMRITKGLRQRIKDVHFERRTIIVHEGEGAKIARSAVAADSAVARAVRAQYASA